MDTFRCLTHFLIRRPTTRSYWRKVIDHYHHTLKESPAGQSYLLKRGINDPKAIDHFRVGLVDYSLVNVLPSYQRATGKAIRARLQGLGLMRSSSHQHFKGCLVFPITTADGSGRVVDIYGRRLSQGLKPASPPPSALVGNPAGRVEHRRLCGEGRSDSLPVLVRWLDLLERRLSERQLHLRSRSLDRGPPHGTARVRHPAGVPDE